MLELIAREAKLLTVIDYGFIPESTVVWKIRPYGMVIPPGYISLCYLQCILTYIMVLIFMTLCRNFGYYANLT